MSKKTERLGDVTMITPLGTAMYAWLNKKDPMADKYKITVLVPKDTDEKARLIVDGKWTNVGVKDMIKRALAFAKEHGGPCKLGERGVHIKDGDDHKNENFRGHWVFEAASPRHQPKVVDTSGAAVGDDTTVFSGDKVKVAIGMSAIKVEAGAIYVPYYISQVMLVEKKQGGAASDVDFGDVDGFIASKEEKEPDFGLGEDDGDDF